MKRLLAFLLSLLPVLAWGANPSFDSFRQTNSGFIVNQPYIYVANTNTGGTNVIINGDVIYTNTTISYFVTTNFYDQSTIIITNSTVTITNSTVTINGTNVATINPTIGRIPFKFSDFQFGDSALYSIDTNTVGTTDLETGIVGVSNLVSGGFVISVDSGLGYGYLTNAPFSDFGLWTNIYGYLQPTDLTQPLFWTNSVTWGPGTTNFLSRTGSDLNWTGSSTDVKFIVNDGSGGAAQLEAQGATAVLSAGGVATGVTLRAGGDQVTLAGGHFIPTVDVSENNGDAHNAWKNVTSTNFIVRGFVDSTDTNYSRLDIYHTGTNGAVVFDSQANGSAGAARDIQFQSNGVFLASMRGIAYSPFNMMANLREMGIFMTNIYSPNLASGENDIYTIPAGYRANVVSLLMGTTNASGGSCFLMVKTNGNYFTVNTTAGAYTLSSSGGLNTPTGGFLYDENESLSVSNTAQGLNLASVLLLMPTNYPMRTVKKYSLSAGDNTLYTTPTGFKAFAGAWQGWVQAGSTLNAYYVNQSGAPRAVKFYVVPNGGSIGNGTQFDSASVSDSSSKSLPGVMMQPGDAFVINTDANTATQTCWMTVFEYPQ